MLQTKSISTYDKKEIVEKDGTTSNYELDEETLSAENRTEELKTKSTSGLVKLGIDLDTKHKLLRSGRICKNRLIILPQPYIFCIN